MKILIWGLLILPFYSYSAVIWDCQCFDNDISSIQLGGTSLKNKNTLRNAEETAVNVCKKFTSENKLIARCHKYVVTDH